MLHLISERPVLMQGGSETTMTPQQVTRIIQVPKQVTTTVMQPRQVTHTVMDQSGQVPSCHNIPALHLI